MTSSDSHRDRSTERYSLALAVMLGIGVSLIVMFPVAFYSMSSALEPENGWPGIENVRAWLVGALAIGPVAGWVLGIAFVRRHRRRVPR